MIFRLITMFDGFISIKNHHVEMYCLNIRFFSLLLFHISLQQVNFVHIYSFFIASSLLTVSHSTVPIFHGCRLEFEHLFFCCHWGPRLTALPPRAAHITAAINYLMGNTEYISFSITDPLSLVQYIVAVDCVPLCFGLPQSLKIPDLRGPTECSFSP